MSETTSADEAAGVASDASVEGAQETPTATTDPPANVPQNGRNGPGDMYLALKRMTHGVTRWYRGPRRVWVRRWKALSAVVHLDRKDALSGVVVESDDLTTDRFKVGDLVKA